MAFQNVRCWNPDLVGKVMDTEALQISDVIFLATHHPAKMYRQDLRLADSHISYDEEQFLVDFLDDKKDFVFTSVLGGSGTGKSHLIRWLSLNIPRNQNRRVILIPKVGTNLREVIRLILQDMEGPQFDRYRERLEMATQSLTESQAREVLLNQLAVAVGPNGSNASDELNDAESYLQEELPNLLYDPFFRSLLLKDGGFIDRLATHILGRNEQVERLEERREFSLEDLPIDIVNHEKASERARGFYEFLVSDPDFQPETVAWLNKNLDAAIGQVLNFKGDDLFNLLLEVREALAEQDIELVVLVEDFAKLQGIDHQLLEALLVRPNQPGRKRLCALRTALAVTTGYFDRLGDTVRQRINFRVNLDIAAGENGGMLTHSDWVQFVARYLNVVRLKDNGLADWFGGRSRGEAVTIPNACAECPHIDGCQTGFGEVGGVSLYPFTETAIQKMFLRVSPEKFNPRLLLNDVLRLTLENYGDALSRGQFPPPALLERLGGSYMEPLLQSKVERMDPVNHARRKVLLELWARGKELIDLHPIIHEAFNLPTLGGAVSPVGEQENNKKQGKPEQPEERKLQPERVGPENEPDIPEGLVQKIEELKNWANGQTLLSQNLTQELREIVYQTVTNYIDWDGEILLAGFFRGQAKPFRPTSVNFVNQSTQAKKTSIELTIPLENQDRTQVAIVLQGLLCYEHFGHWNFPNGDTYLMAYAKHLEQWGKHVLGQVRQTLTYKGEWDPVPEVVELLAVGSAMAGLTPPLTPLSKQLSALFRNPNVDLTNRSPSWKKLYEEFEKQRQAMQEILLSRIGCTKGGVSSVKILDVSQILQPLKQLAKVQRPSIPVPDGLRKEYEAIYKMRSQVDALLLKAIEEEKSRTETWYQNVTAYMGDASYEAIVEELKSAISKAKKEGAFPGRDASKLESTLLRFKCAGATKFMQRVENVVNMDGEGKILPALGYLEQGTMQEISNLLQRTNQFLDDCLKRVDQDIQDLLTKGGDDIVQIQQVIDEHLTKLTTLVLQGQGGRYDSK